MTAILDENVLRVKVSGDFACFTRPDLKVERMTYPCMTASAARGILDSILWKPEFKWYVRRILLLKPVTFASIQRNELKQKIKKAFYIEDLDSKGKPAHRTQRNSIILRDAAYIIEASVYQDAYDANNLCKKYVEMFRRRVKQGQCFRRPFLGTREFSCEFEEPTAQDYPIQDTIPIGSMFFDMHYDANGKVTPLYAHDVAVRDGVLDFEAFPELQAQLMQASHIRPPVQAGMHTLLQWYADAEAKEVTYAQ